MNHGRMTFGTGVLTLAIAGVSIAITIGVASAFAVAPHSTVAKPLLVVRAGARGLSVAATRLAPGDTVQRTAILVNAGTTVLHGVSATVSAAASTPPPAGLQVRVDGCPVAWKASRASLVCPSKAVQLAGWQPVGGPPMALVGSAGLKPGAQLQLRVSVQVPSSLEAAFAGTTGAVTWTFTAV